MIVYNVPAGLVERYRNEEIVVRIRHPREIEARLSELDTGKIRYIQLAGWTPHEEVFNNWAIPAPVDLVLADPGESRSFLYRYAALPTRNPLRVTVPVVPGFRKTARLAASLNMAVKLDVAQPGEKEVLDLLDLADRYLHQTTVSQPIEFFHGVLKSYVHETWTTLWILQEDDPERFRYVTDNGEVLLPGRISEKGKVEDAGSMLDDLARELRAGGSECARCDYWEVCRGYFKQPRQDYSCDGVKEIFRVLREAAGELKNTLDAVDGQIGEVGK
jgi:hypothetical protein